MSKTTVTNLEYISHFARTQIEKRESELGFYLGKLMSAAQHDIIGLSDLSGDLTSVAIKARNIFEIYLIAQNIVSSNDELKKWIGQMAFDDEALYKGFCSICTKRGFSTKEMDELQEEKRKDYAALNIPSHGGFQMRQLAEKFDHKEDYEAMYSLSSKLAHPSSWRVNGFDHDEGDRNYEEVLKIVARHFVSKLADICEEHNKGHA